MLENALGFLNSQVPKVVSIPRIERIELKKPKGREKDLADVANIWFQSAIEKPTPYPEFSTVPKYSAPSKPGVLFIGTSFSFVLIELMMENKLHREIDFIFWDNRHMHWPSGRSSPFKPEVANWDTLLFNKDLVILEAKRGCAFMGAMALSR